MSDPHRNSTTPGTEELRADIERTRAALADTVDALTGRLDVKARTRARAEEIVRDPRNRTVGLGLAVTAVVVLAVVIWRKRR